MEALILKVCSECGCSTSRAESLLSLCHDDPLKAIEHHRMLQSMLGNRGHSAAVGPPSTAYLPPPPGPHLQVTAGIVPAASPAAPSASSSLSVARPLTGWDFAVPQLPKSECECILNGPISNGADSAYQDLVKSKFFTFNLRQLCAAVQHGATLEQVASHLKDFDDDVVKGRIGDTVDGVPSIFYAAASMDPAILRLWASRGANLSAVHPASGTPLLAFAVAQSEIKGGYDSSDMVVTLLSLGASPKCIPDAFYKKYNRDLSEQSLVQNIDGVDVNAANGAAKSEWLWCKPSSTRQLMARSTNLTTRYYLDRATRIPPPGVRYRQVLSLRNAEGALGIPHFLIGQSAATNQLLRKLLTYMTMRRNKPLVLVFAGPSGHGKTELARKLGYLLSLALEVVNCTIVNHEPELFGPRAPYVGSERGSSLNNFLAANDGRRSIVFLDEFEKTTQFIHHALLVPFDNGEYQNRHTLKIIDCKQTIWILATNSLDETITDFCKANPAILSPGTADSGQTKLVNCLTAKLRATFLEQLGAPITGRVSDFIPFLPFSEGEQAVVTHKFLLSMSKQVAGPVVLKSGGDTEQNLLGNVRLQVSRDASVCNLLAETGYRAELGARSLHKAVDDLQDKLVELYLDEDSEIVENAQAKTNYVVDVRGKDVVVRKA